MAYQLWDTAQAFCSSITGALSTQAILKGVGVGSEEASVVSATITWLCGNGVGMFGEILFAWSCGTQLDYDCKKWRLLADVLNDIAIMMSLVAAHFQSWFLVLLCGTNLCRAIVGVAGGATRAAVIQHQSLTNNLADVAAKDGSQETIVNFIALLFNLFLIPLISLNNFLIWTMFALFTTLHILSNYRAICTLKFSTLNRKRLAILTRHFLLYRQVLDIDDVNDFECRLKELFTTTGRIKFNYGLCMNDPRLTFTSPPTTAEYIVSPFYVGSTLSEVSLLLGVNATPRDMLMATFHAHFLVHHYETRYRTDCSFCFI
ncbi:unnamed protein product [Soboliphyme baturini]|uniref:ABC transmembrane type-1 domain-containing protein n=1 Tax=Soboliphyme baturini TaxID=241478 RepID=A0A183JAX6_9BILA|nr:unnamed protein product [Soboliphyme baturini]